MRKMTDDEAQRAYPFLRLLLVEKEHHNQLCEILIAVLNSSSKMDPERVYDLVHDWRLSRRSACDAELERIYDRLHEDINKQSRHYIERENLQRAQASRRRHRPTTKKEPTKQ